MVTVAQVRAMLEEIKSAAASGEDDVAHALEDFLFVEALESIVSKIKDCDTYDGYNSVVLALAETALESYEIEFSRGCEKY